MSTSASPTRTGGTGLLALAGVLWGTGGLLGSLLDDTAGLPPIAVAAYRLGLGGLLLAAALAVTGIRPPSGRAAWRRIVAVACLAALFQAAYFSAVALTGVGIATLVTIGTSPVVVLAVEAARGRAGRGTALTVGAALAGLTLLVGPGAADGGPGAAPAGAALAVLAGAAFATVTLLAARPVPGLDDAPTTAAAFVLGGLLLVPVAGGGLTFAPDPATLALLVALAVVPTALAYTAYFRGLRRASGPTVGAVLALLEPLTATVLAVALLGERLGVAAVAGAGLLGVAVLRAARRG